MVRRHKLRGKLVAADTATRCACLIFDRLYQTNVFNGCKAAKISGVSLNAINFSGIVLLSGIAVKFYAYT
ncbi:MAG: hypothetical protein OFPII_15890 [Osedax symbiont Rs1]|nr:MAG: hypothetical protein OFPII_15890 [Osedax symbiont Rs1]